MKVRAEFDQNNDPQLDMPEALILGAGIPDANVELPRSESDVAGPPGGRGDDGGDKRYGSNHESGDGDGDRDGQRPEQSETTKRIGAQAMEAADPRTEAVRYLPQRVAEIEALRGEADSYKACATKPDPFVARPAGPRKPSFTHMSKGSKDMTALVEQITKDPNWGGPLVLYPKERLITSAHKATIAQLKAVRAKLKAVNGGLVRDIEQTSAALDKNDVHHMPLEELEDLQAKLAQAANEMPSAETVDAIIKAYNWLVGVKGERANERPEIGVTANFLPRQLRYNAHVGPVITSRDRALGMAKARSGVISTASEVHNAVREIAERDELITRTDLLGVLEEAKREITDEALQAAVRERRPEAGRLVAAETFIISQLTATMSDLERLDAQFLKEPDLAPLVTELKRPVLAGIAEDARLKYETGLTQNLNRDVTRARAITTGMQRVLDTFGNGQRKSFEQTAEELDVFIGTPERPYMLTRAEAGLLLATIADPDRLMSFRATVERVQTAAEDDEALRIVARDRDRAIAELQQVDPDELVSGLRDKLAIARNQNLLSVALTDEQQRQARIALGWYFDPAYDEPLPVDDEAGDEDGEADMLTDKQLDEVLRAADENLLEHIKAHVDPEEGLLKIMEALGLDISGDEIDVVLGWANREIQRSGSDEPLDVETLLLGMLGELEAARLEAASALEIPSSSDDAPGPEVAEEPQTIETVIESYEQLGFTIFPVGEQAFAEAQNIEEEARTYDPGARIDINRVGAMVQFAKAWNMRPEIRAIPEERRHMFIARGQLGNRGTVQTEEGVRARNEYLVLVMLQADEQGHIRQQCWADSPITRRNASYAWDSEAARLPFPNWERIYAGTKQAARDVGRARQLKHTAPGDADVNATMMQRVWALLTGNPEEFYRDTRHLK